MPYRASIEIARPFDDVAETLLVRPASWLRPFLIVALGNSTGVRRPASHPWFRFGPAVTDEVGALTSQLIWHPGPNMGFNGFRGSLSLRKTRTGCKLSLDGTIDGNQSAVPIHDRLLTVLASSFEHQDSGV